MNDEMERFSKLAVSTSLDKVPDWYFEQYGLSREDYLKNGVLYSDEIMDEPAVGFSYYGINKVFYKFKTIAKKGQEKIKLVELVELDEEV